MKYVTWYCEHQRKWGREGKHAVRIAKQKSCANKTIHCEFQEPKESGVAGAQSGVEREMPWVEAIETGRSQGRLNPLSSPSPLQFRKLSPVASLLGYKPHIYAFLNCELGMLLTWANFSFPTTDILFILQCQAQALPPSQRTRTQNVTTYMETITAQIRSEIVNSSA